MQRLNEKICCTLSLARRDRRVLFSAHTQRCYESRECYHHEAPRVHHNAARRITPRRLACPTRLQSRSSISPQFLARNISLSTASGVRSSFTWADVCRSSAIKLRAAGIAGGSADRFAGCGDREWRSAASDYSLKLLHFARRMRSITFAMPSMALTT
jgi:hypothetical protein